MAAHGGAQPFAEPTQITAAGFLGETGIDDWAVCSLTFEGGLTAQVSTGVGLGDVNTVKVYVGDGYLDVPNPWLPSRDDRPAGREELAALGRDGALRRQVRIIGLEDDQKDKQSREEQRRAEREAKRKAEAERLARLGY